MVKIDLKDRKILYHLDLDARQSLTQVGKKVGLKKDVVAYRVQRMQKDGIIKNLSQKTTYQTTPFPDFLQKIIEAGGLIKWIKRTK